MESIQIAVKRKKRRTRKCLDEIRKRSRRTDQIYFPENYNENITKQNMQTNFITSRRLTLRMFPKAIRSETITRPVLAELNQKPKLNLDDLVKGTKVLSTTFSSLIHDIENLNENNSSSNSDEYSYLKHSSININGNDILNNQDKLSKSFILFSPTNSTNMEIRSKSLNRIGVSICTASLSQSLNDNAGYNLYEEFMSDIPKYLKHNTLEHSEDVMKKTKVILQNLFIENHNKNCEGDILKCLQSTTTNYTHSSKEIIVYNPMDYLRLGHVQTSSLFHKINESFMECVNTPHSPAEPPTTAASDSPCSFIVHDTPEYTFYPHRLN